MEMVMMWVGVVEGGDGDDEMGRGGRGWRW